MDVPAEALIEPGPSKTLTAEDTSCASHARPRGKAAPSKFSIVICTSFQFILWKIQNLINIEHNCPLTVYI